MTYLTHIDRVGWLFRVMHTFWPCVCHHQSVMYEEHSADAEVALRPSVVSASASLLICFPNRRWVRHD